MTAQKEKNLKRQSILAALLLILMLLPVIVLFRMHRENLRVCRAVIARLNETDPEGAEEILKMLFRKDFPKQEADCSTEVLLKYGYTSEGMKALGRARFPKRLLLLISASALLSGMAAFFLYRRIRKEEQQENTDVRERMKALREENSAIGYLNAKVERMKAFIENIAHQIKTPVSRMVVSLEYLKNHPEEQYARIPECLSHVNDIGALATRLIEIGRMEAGAVVFRAEELDLRALLQDTVQAAGGEGRCVIRTEGTDFLWNGDYDWTQEAVKNLLVNCLEHDKSDQPVELSLREEKEYIYLSIRDHGPGFSAEDLPNLFDRFYQPEETKKGHAGIGLNLSKLILEAQRGSVRAENAEGGGAVFRIRLPRFAILNRKTSPAEITG